LIPIGYPGLGIGRHDERREAMRRAAGIIVMALLAGLLSPMGGARGQTREFVIIFGTGASQLTPEGQGIVKLIAERAAAQNPATIAVAGYGDADAGGDTELADRRAATVIQALVDAGVAPGEIKQVPRKPPATATGIPVHKVTVTVAP
jgi:outer membrane protein OmpA-like peptidoglycan-associated protein